jgi:hypothetical protein
MLRMWNNQEENKGRIARFCIRSVIGYGVGILVYQKVLMRPIVSYVSNTVPGIKSFIPNFVRNLLKYYSVFRVVSGIDSAVV